MLLLTACIEAQDVCTTTAWYYDGDADGFGNAAAELVQCDQPAGYVGNATDCDDGDATIGDSLTWYTDADGDGFGAGEPTLACDATGVADRTDCDDADGTVFPGAQEACNERDDDCDGATDEDAIDGTLYRDADGDGFGAGEAIECSGVAAAGDCDDADGLVNPLADERCGGPDEDCDGDPSANATDQATWYLDEDADGYGVSAVTDKLACDQPEGYAAADGDCDDTDPRFHPGSESEACDDPTDYDCDGSVSFADADLDGWAACTECDDTQSAVNPDAIEVCDELDNDCDGDVDPDTSADAGAWYLDADEDGAGAGTPLASCRGPVGYVSSDDDCDDGDASVTTHRWYADADADGWGAGSAIEACDAPGSGYVAIDGDCDDTRSDVSPTATEVCDSLNTDEDCDGLADDEDDAPADTSTMYQDADGDGYGSSITGQFCDTSAGWTTAGDDCDDTDDTVHPAAGEVCDDGIDQDCDGTAGACSFTGERPTTSADFSITSTASANLGYAMATGDVDADGHLDLMVSDATAGHVVVFDGPFSAATTYADTLWASITGSGQWGRAVVNAGHLDGDGVDFLAVTWPLVDSNAGTVYLWSDTYEFSEFYAGTSADDYCGLSAGAAGDGDADGLDDFAYGCPSAAAPYVVWRSGATRNLSSVGVSGAAGAGCGYGVGGLGDTDGDGYDDLGIGCTGSGIAYIVYGPPTAGSVTSVGEVLATGTTSASVGQNLAGGADFDGDGYDDAIVSAHDDGEAWLYAGAADRSLSKVATFDGPAADRLGGALLLPGDLNGDDVPDIVLSAMGAATSCHSAGGAAFLFYAPVLGTVTTSDADGSVAGCTAAGAANSLTAGDLNDDGTTDLVVGEYGNSTVYGVFGSGI